MFDINTKVVCIDDIFPPGINDIMNALPKRDSIYTVRDIVPGIEWGLAETAAVLLVELHNKPNRHGIEPGFNVNRFREVEEVEEVNYTYATATL